MIKQGKKNLDNLLKNNMINSNIKFNKQAIKQILKAPTIEGKQVYYFKLNKYKDNYISLLKAMYIHLRTVFKYKASDFRQLRKKMEMYPNWNLTSISEKQLNEFRNLMLRITYFKN